jgi:hypothetical protein
MAIEMAMQQMQGGAAGGAPAGMPPAAGGAGMPPAAPPAQAGAMPPEQSAGMPAMKSENKLKKLGLTMTPEEAREWSKKHGEGSKEESSKEGSGSKEGSKEEPVKKSELDAVHAKLDVALKAVEFLTRPMRKAVTEFAVTEAKAPSMTKSEVTAKLKEVTASPTLAKSDRHLVNGFYDGRVSLDQIAHLLK